MVVNSLYYGDTRQAQLAHKSYTFDSDVLERALRRIYERDFQPMTDIERNLFHEFCKTFNSATDKGLHGAPTPDDDFIQALRHNNAVFAAFKTHRLQNDIAAQLLDSNGNLKPFEQWKKDVLPITSHQCGAWLRTEYDTAVLRARQAANWQQFIREADVLPNLKWIPSTSPNPGADHQPFWNTVLPIAHDFWNQHRPGDRWNCKCDLQSTDEPPTSVPSVTSESSGNNPQPGLDSNPGIDAKLFADSHPYIAHAHKGAQEAVENAVEQLETRLQEYERLKKDPDYKDVEFNAGNGGLKAVHFGHNFDKVGGEYEKKVMEIGFKTGNCVILADERGNDTKHIEGTWNGLSMEVSGKNGKSSNNLKKGLIHCAEKPGCKVAIIYIYEDVFDIKLIDKAIDRYIGLRNCEGPWVAFDEVICMHKGIIVYQKSHPMQK